MLKVLGGREATAARGAGVQAGKQPSERGLRTTPRQTQDAKPLLTWATLNSRTVMGATKATSPAMIGGRT
jgi:hypothetical protein